MERSILHVDMDAFFAAVEQRDHPEWRGRPLIVGAPPDRRGVVATCSYEARAFGIRSAMPSREAFRRCPHAIFVPCRMSSYDEVSRQVFAIFTRFSPLVEPVSIDEAFIDVTGVRNLFGEGRQIGEQIREMIHTELQLTASVGVASNKFLAKIASEQAKPDGLFVMPQTREEIKCFLATLPVRALWGVGSVTNTALQRAGYHIVADLQHADPAALEPLLGKTLAAHLRLLANGEDMREVNTSRVDKSISREQTFDKNCCSQTFLRNVLKDLVEDVGRRVRAKQHYATCGRIKLRWADFRTITRQASFSTPVCDDFSFRELALRLFDTEHVTRPVRLIGFGVSGFCNQFQEQRTLFDKSSDAREKRERLCHTVDALREQLGDQAIGCPLPQKIVK